METPADRSNVTPPPIQLASPAAHVAPPPQGRPVPAVTGMPAEDIGQNAGMRALLPVGRCPMAIVAGYLGLLSLIPVIGLVCAVGSLAFALGAHLRIRANDQLHGMGRVIFAYVCCGISVAGHIWFLSVRP